MTTTQSSIVTMSDIKARIIAMSDMQYSDFIENEDGSGELVNYIQQSQRKLYNLIAKRYKDYFVGPPVEFTIPAGENTYTIDVDFLKLSGIDRSIGGNRWKNVYTFNFGDRNNRSDRIDRTYYPLVRYRLIGNLIYFIPPENAPGTYRYWYTPKPNIMVNDDDTMEGYNGWDEYIVLDCAIKCLNKEESDVSVLLMERNQLEESILVNASIRDESEVDVVREVDSDYSPYDWYL